MVTSLFADPVCTLAASSPALGVRPSLICAGLPPDNLRLKFHVQLDRVANRDSPLNAEGHNRTKDYPARNANLHLEPARVSRQLRGMVAAVAAMTLLE